MDSQTYPKLNSTEDVAAACAARPDVAPYARLVGRWVWCEFPSKPSQETRTFLSQTGFRWNKQRLAWQHSCGFYCRQNRRIDPREVYGQAPINGHYEHRPSGIESELNNFQAA